MNEYFLISVGLGSGNVRLQLRLIVDFQVLQPHTVEFCKVNTDKA